MHNISNHKCYKLGVGTVDCTKHLLGTVFEVWHRSNMMLID